MGRNDLWKRTNRITDNHEPETVMSSKKGSITQNLLTQHAEELVYPGNSNMTIMQY